MVRKGRILGKLGTMVLSIPAKPMMIYFPLGSSVRPRCDCIPRLVPGRRSRRKRQRAASPESTIAESPNMPNGGRSRISSFLLISFLVFLPQSPMRWRCRWVLTGSTWDGGMQVMQLPKGCLVFLFNCLMYCVVFNVEISFFIFLFQCWHLVFVDLLTPVGIRALWFCQDAVVWGWSCLEGGDALMVW